MEAIFSELVKLLERGQEAVLATVVTARGSTPQKPGAKLLVRADGTTLGTLGGGCVEAEAWQEAMQAQGGEARLSRFSLSDDLAADSGLLCGGTMEVLIDPWGPPALPLAREIAKALAGGPPVALATLIQGGARLCVGGDGRLMGDLGGPALEAEAAQASLALLAQGGAQLVELRGKEIFVEAFQASPILLIAGAGHVAQTLYTLALPLGFQVVVADDRPDFASRERFPQAQALLVGDIEEAIRGYPSERETFIVVATRGHKLDYQALRSAAASPARYIGLVGSRRKVLLLYRQLLRDGIPPERLRDIHAPVGLHLGGRTPEEIGLSILAEIVMERRGGDGRPLKMDISLALKKRV